jgi:hypothetical protein
LIRVIVAEVRRESGLLLLGLCGCLTAGEGQDTSLFGEGTQIIGEAGEDSSSESGEEDSTSTTQSDPSITSGDNEASSGSSGGITPVCGNDMMEGTEMCDGTDVGELSCADEGFTHGEIICTDDCLGYSTDGCHVCGNGMLDGPETCDGGVPVEATCANSGKTEGTLSCNETTCMLDLSGCSLCGDGDVEGTESCDSAELGDATCASIGFGGGTLACSDEDCTFDVSACEGGNFVEDWESGAISGDWTLGGVSNWTLVNSAPLAGSWSARSGAIDHSQQSSISIDMSFPSGGTISFRHRESSEANYDYLRFFIDAVEQDAWSGENAAATANYDVAAGTHTFEFRYSKDGSVHFGSDAVWIDDITADGGAPV